MIAPRRAAHVAQALGWAGLEICLGPGLLFVDLIPVTGDLHSVLRRSASSTDLVVPSLLASDSLGWLLRSRPSWRRRDGSSVEPLMSQALRRIAPIGR
ncbi:MAG: hypothetical protein ACI8RE_001708 [Ilumatobacter sp.]|jgi:hypothetical protein